MDAYVGGHAHPIFGYWWVTHMIYMRYNDMWKLEKVTGWASMTIVISYLMFSNRISS
jgi:hypothetical protein